MKDTRAKYLVDGFHDQIYEHWRNEKFNAEEKKEFLQDLHDRMKDFPDEVLEDISNLEDGKDTEWF